METLKKNKATKPVLIEICEQGVESMHERIVHLELIVFYYAIGRICTKGLSIWNWQ